MGHSLAPAARRPVPGRGGVSVYGSVCTNAVRPSGGLSRGLAVRLRHLLDIHTGYNEGCRLGIVGQVFDFALADSKFQAEKLQVGATGDCHTETSTRSLPSQCAIQSRAAGAYRLSGARGAFMRCAAPPSLAPSRSG